MSFLSPTDTQEPAPDIENESWDTPGPWPPSSHPPLLKLSYIQTPSVSQKPPSMRPSDQHYPSKEDMKPPVTPQGEGQATDIPQGDLTTSVPQGGDQTTGVPPGEDQTTGVPQG